jgi:hypothetical protein
LARHGLIEKLFARFDEQQWQSGLMPKDWPDHRRQPGQRAKEPQQAGREQAD